MSHSIIIVRAMLVNDDGDILVLRRSADDEHNPGGVDFPGGGVESSESCIEAIIREIHEETGLVIAKKDLELGYASTKLDTKTEIVFVRLLFIAHTPITEVSLSREHDRYWWRQPEELEDLFQSSSWSEGIQFVHTYHLDDR